MNPDRKAPVTLEELLRVKRLERPPAEFWTEFESELRAKQLAAIVEKRPWWTVSARFSGIFFRYQLPLGAAAALAVAVGGFHEYQAMALVSGRRAGAQQVAVARPEVSVAAISAAAPLAANGRPAAGQSVTSANLTEATVGSTPMASVLGASEPATASVTVGRSFPAISGYANGIEAVSVRNDFSSRNWGTRVDSLSGRSIALNLPASRASEPLGLARSLDSSLVPERAQVTEPLAQMTSPAEEDRARLLATALPVASFSSETAPPSSDRFVSHLQDDRRLYESISRYDLGGDRLKVKF